MTQTPPDLPAGTLAGQPDVEARLGRPLTAQETTSLPAKLADASAAVIGYCRTDFTDTTPVPGAVVGVVAKMVIRQLQAGEAPAFMDQQSLGSLSVHYAAVSTSGDTWLTGTDKLALRPYRKGGGLVSVPLAGEHGPR